MLGRPSRKSTRARGRWGSWSRIPRSTIKAEETWRRRPDREPPGGGPADRVDSGWTTWRTAKKPRASATLGLALYAAAFFCGGLVRDPWFWTGSPFPPQGGLRWNAVAARAGIIESTFGAAST